MPQPRRDRRRAVASRSAAMIGVALILSACTSDSAPTPEQVPEPEAVETCDGLVDVGRQLVRAWVHVVEELRVDTLLEETLPPEFTELERLGTDLDARARGLGCDLEVMNTEIAAEVADLTTDSPSAAIVLDIIAGGLVTPETTTPPTTGAGASIPPVTTTTTATG